MKNRANTKYVKAGLTAFLVIAAGIVFYYLLFHTKSFKSGVGSFFSAFSSIFYGLIIAYILNPLMQLIEDLVLRILTGFKKIKLTRVVRLIVRIGSVFASVLAMGFIVYGLFKLLLPQLIDSIRNIIRNYPVYEANVVNFVNNTFSNPEASETTNNLLSYADQLYDWFVNWLPDLDKVFSNVTTTVLGIFTFLVRFILGIIISIYVLTSKEILAARTKRMMYAFLPVKTGNRILHNLRFVDEKFGGFIIGKVIDSAIIGVICYIFMLILRMPYSILISVVIGVTNVIPFFGPFIGGIPCAILVFVISPFKSITFIIFIVLLQQFDGNILGPRILGNATGLSGLMVVVAIILCNNIFGVAGAFFGVPLVAVIVGFVQAEIRKMVTKKNLPRELTFYDNLSRIDEETLAALPLTREDLGSSLYDRIKHQDEELAAGGVSRFLKDEEHRKKTDDTSELPPDPVNVTEEEAMKNHNIPLVR